MLSSVFWFMEDMLRPIIAFTWNFGAELFWLYLLSFLILVGFLPKEAFCDSWSESTFLSRYVVPAGVSFAFSLFLIGGMPVIIALLPLVIILAFFVGVITGILFLLRKLRGDC